MKQWDHIIVRRCRELAAGAAPESNVDGICWDVYRTLAVAGVGAQIRPVYERLGEAFIGLGLDPTNPLGDFWLPGEAWEGPRGERRRDLAAQVADWIESQHKKKAA